MQISDFKGALGFLCIKLALFLFERNLKFLHLDFIIISLLLSQLNLLPEFTLCLTRLLKLFGQFLQLEFVVV